MPTALIVIGLSLALPQSNPATEPGLAAHWDFNKGQGDVAVDRSGGGHDGQIHDAAWERTDGGGGLRFGGKNSYVTVPRKTAFDLSGDVTLVAWVKPLASPFRNPRTNYVILAARDYAPNGFVIRVEGESGRVRYVGFRDGGVNLSTSQSAVTPNEFHQVVFVKKGDQCAWYVNGRADGTGRMPRTGTLSDTLWISDPSQSFDGLIDEVKVYCRALSSEEVLRDYRDHAAAYGRDFAVEPGLSYAVSVNAAGPIAADRTGTLNVPLTLDGLTEMVIRRVARDASSDGRGAQHRAEHGRSEQ